MTSFSPSTIQLDTSPSLQSLLLPLLVACLALGLPASATAADSSDDGLDSYFEFSAGASFVPYQTLRNGTSSMSRVESEPGFYIGGALGTRVFDTFRAEIAVSYREAAIDQMSLTGPASTADGEISLISALLNGYFDLDLGIGVIPYVGAGLGWGQFQLDGRTKTAGSLDIDDTDSVFVYNAMVGAVVPITRVASASLGYRYIGIEGTDNISAEIGQLHQNIRAEFDAHEVTIGLRFHF